jgi:hypothetical protein
MHPHINPNSESTLSLDFRLRESGALESAKGGRTLQNPDERCHRTNGIARGVAELTILEKNRLEGLKRMKEANKCVKQLLAQYPDAADAYIEPGIANYIVGSLIE